MRRYGAPDPGTTVEYVRAAPADGVSGGGYNTIFADTPDEQRRHQIERNWSALLAELRQPVEATLRGGMSAGDIAYRLGALVHGFFRARGVTLISVELRRVVIALLENHRRGWPAAEPGTEIIAGATTKADLPSDALVAFVDRKPHPSPTAGATGLNGDAVSPVPPIVTPDLLSSLVSLDQHQLEGRTSPDAPEPVGQLNSATLSVTRPVSHRMEAHHARDPSVETVGGDAMHRVAAGEKQDQGLATQAIATSKGGEGRGRAGSAMRIDLGPLDVLMRDGSVATIFVDGPQSVFIDRGGRRERAAVAFGDVQQLHDLAERLTERIGPASGGAHDTLINAPLDDGSRVTILSPPLAPSGPHLVIHRPSTSVTSLDGLVGEDVLSPRMADVLRLAMRARLNLLVCGAQASDHTAVLAALVLAAAPADRVVSLARTTPLRPDLPNHVRLVDVGAGAADAKRAFSSALALRPDHLVIDDVDASVMPDLAFAAEGGAEGIVAGTIAPAAQAFERWEQALCAADTMLSHDRARQRLARAFQLILQVEQVRGVRRVTRLAEPAGDGDPARHGDLFTYDDRARRFIATGLRPRFLARLSRDVEAAWLGESP